MPDTPEYIPYVNEDKNKRPFPDLGKEVTPELGDEHVQASVMLPRGSQMMCCTVKACKRDLDGNPINWPSDNSILDTCLYGK